MKRILISLLTVAVVGGVGVTATRAFFSDKETSTGNTFQAGTLDLVIDSEQHYNGNVCQETAAASGVYQWTGNASYPVLGSSCTGTWPPQSLTQNKFFDFIDVKPGDWGENTISFTASGNSAWMCANLDITSNSDLGKYLNVFWWVDTNHNNIYETGEKILYGGPRTIDGWLSIVGKTPGQNGTLPLTFADSVLNWISDATVTPIPPIPANETQYLGVGWCFGGMSITGTGNPGFSCDGNGDQQDAQGDCIVGDLSFDVAQWRNNSNFLCPEHK